MISPRKKSHHPIIPQPHLGRQPQTGHGQAMVVEIASQKWCFFFHIYICVCMYVCMYVCIYIYDKIVKKKWGCKWENEIINAIINADLSHQSGRVENIDETLPFSEQNGQV
jgi:hypothetical protein